MTTPPPHLPPDVAAVWVEVVTDLGDQASGVVGPELDAYCGQVARLREAHHRLAAEGMVVADPKGNPVPHPAIAIERAAASEIRAWGSKFRRLA
jgi:phage terminase small subunit